MSTNVGREIVDVFDVGSYQILIGKYLWAMMPPQPPILDVGMRFFMSKMIT